MRTLLLVSLAVTTAAISTVSLAAGNESSQAAKGPPVIKSEQLQKTGDAGPIPTPKRAEFAPPRQVDNKPAPSGPGLPSSRQIEVTEQQPGPGPAPIVIPPALKVEQAPTKVQVQAAPPPAVKLVEAPAPQQVQVAPSPAGVQSQVEQVQVEATSAPQEPAPAEAQGTGPTEAAPPTEVQLAPVAPEAKPVKKAKRKVIVRYYEDDYGYNDGYGYGSGYASSDDYGYGGSTNAGYSSNYGSSNYGGGYDDSCN